MGNSFILVQFLINLVADHLVHIQLTCDHQYMGPFGHRKRAEWWEA